MQKFNELKDIIAKLEEDAKKFYEKENSAAGTRLRKGLQEIKVLAQVIRQDVSETKNKTK